eukprot:COSAG01_NODE_7459_length_3203_cov_14.089562_5_plen_100_part_00
MPTDGYEGAVRLGDMKLLFRGMQTVTSGIRSSRFPPAGFVPAVPDIFPQGVNITLNSSTTTVAWLFNVSSDPQEMTNLAVQRNRNLLPLSESLSQLFAV